MVKPPEDILNGADDTRTDPKFNHKIGFIPFAYHLVPLRGLAKIAAVMRKGERKDRNGWEQVPVDEHINHVISHLISYLSGKHADHHLANAGCRILMALDLDNKEVLPSPVLGGEPVPVPDISDEQDLAYSIKEVFDYSTAERKEPEDRGGKYGGTDPIPFP